LDRAHLFRAARRIAEQARRQWPRRLTAAASGRAKLDSVLDALPEDVREVFVLCEIERCDVGFVSATLGHEPRWAQAQLRRGQRAFCSHFGVTMNRKHHDRLEDAVNGEAGQVLRAGRAPRASAHAKERTLRAVEAVGATSLFGRVRLLFSRLSLAV